MNAFDRIIPVPRRMQLPLFDAVAGFAQAVEKNIDHFGTTAQAMEFVELVIDECRRRGVSVPAAQALKRSLELMVVTLANRRVDEEVKHDQVAGREELDFGFEVVDATPEPVDFLGSVHRGLSLSEGDTHAQPR